MVNVELSPGVFSPSRIKFESLNLEIVFENWCSPSTINEKNVFKLKNVQSS